VALILFSSSGGIKPSQQTIEIFHDGLGYPIYFIQFISIAKVLGCIAILIPGSYRVKEWAYAGLYFDLTGAVYSGIAVSNKFDPLILTMLIWIVPGIVSYYFWQKKMKGSVASKQ
jgi:uncharacterized membrane protein YphA (DoxX/SURF4 family)